MPELPEVETLRLSLLPHLPGRRFTEIRVNDARLRKPVATAQLRTALTGKCVDQLRRRGKYLLIDAVDHTLVVHLGMSGRMTLADPKHPCPLHTHVIFGLDNGRELRFTDPRRFGMVEAIRQRDLADYPPLKVLGLEPLDSQCDPQKLFDRSRRLQKPIKNFLMDSHVVVGIGNIYASESLYEAGIRPTRRCGSLKFEEWVRLVHAFKKVLRKAIKQGGTTLNDFADSSGKAGYFQVALKVYDRGGQPCKRCRTPIRRAVQAGRATYWCHHCQK